MNVVSLYFALWITVDNGLDDLWVGLSNSLSMFLVAITLPLLGVLSDMAGRRVPYLVLMTVISCVATAMIGAVGMMCESGLVLAATALFLFVIANYAYQGGLVFYNALLPAVSSKANMGRISGYGVAAGYLGAILGLMMVEPFVTGKMRGLEIPLLMAEWEDLQTIESMDQPVSDRSIHGQDFPYAYRIVFPEGSGEETLVVTPDSVQISPDGARSIFWTKARVDMRSGANDHVSSAMLQRRREGFGRTAAFLPTAVLFLMFSLPVFFFIRERTYSDRRVVTPDNLRLAVRRIRDVLIDTAAYPGVRRVLIAKYLYEDAISTVIVFMGVYSVKVMGMKNEALITFFIVSTTTAMVGGIIAGFIIGRLGPKRLLEATLIVWTLCLISAALTHSVAVFWIIGSVVGICLGSTWTAARPFFIELVPEEMLGEFFGLYSLSGKLAAIIGPLLWGGIVYVLSPYGVVAYRVAILSLALMVCSGLLVLFGVRGKEK